MRSLLTRCIRKAKRMMSLLAYRIQALKEPIEDDKILLITTRGSYNCNPRAIADEIIRQRLPWKLVWVVRSENKENVGQYPNQLKLVLRDSREYYQEAARAKIIIDNAMSYAYSGAHKRKGQIFCQTWHGSLGLKRFETSKDKKWVYHAKRNGKITDCCFSNSTFETELFRNTFWKNANIIKTGHARNDILLTSDADRIAKIKTEVIETLGIPKEARVALYAPTFRDDGQRRNQYALDYENVKKALEKRFGGEWIFLVRMHYTTWETMKNRPEYPECVIDATDYPDIQDLLLVADAGITDYSSWICDYVLTRRPAFLFATDLKDYYNERGFYYPLEEAPFPLAEGNAGLVENILSFNEEEYRKKCDDFIRDKGCIDDGHAAERVVDILKKKLSMEKHCEKT